MRGLELNFPISNLKTSALTLLFSLLLTVVFCQEATLYLYRKSKFKGSFISYNLYVDSTLVGRMNSGTVLVFHPAPGTRNIWGKTESKQGIYVVIEEGKTYFVECDVSLGVAVGVPHLRQTKPEKAITDIIALNPALKFDPLQSASYAPTQANPEADTVAALSNLYHRKRKAGRVWGGILVGLSISSLIQGGAGSSLVPLGFSMIGFGNASKYSEVKLNGAIEGYQNGTPIPRKIKSKMKAKDFR